MTISFRHALAVATLLALSACGGDDPDDAFTGYSAEMRDDFVDDCSEAGTARDACGCLYDAFEAEVPFDRFQDLDEQLRSGATTDVPADIEALAVGCAADPDSSSAAD